MTTLEPISIPIGRVIARAVTVTAGALRVILPLALVVAAPYLALDWWGMTTVEIASDSGGVYLRGLEQLVGLTFRSMMEAFVVAVVFPRLGDRDVPLGKAVRDTLERLPAVIVTSLLVGLVIGGSAGACLLVVGRGPIWAIATSLAGLLLLVVLPRWCLATVLVVLERRFLVGALRRSTELLYGSTFRVFVAMFLVHGAIWAVSRGIWTWQERNPGAGAGAWNFAWVLDTAVRLVFQVYWAVFVTVLYREIRERREGVGVEELERLFE